MSGNAPHIDVIKKYCRYRDELICEPASGGSKLKYRVYDPINDISYEIGHIELELATMFNGDRSLFEIQQLSKTYHNFSISLEKLKNFQARLLQLGLLTHIGGKEGITRDPATGITYGPLKRYMLINLVKMNPQRGLDILYSQAYWLCTPRLNSLLLTVTAAGFLYLFYHWPVFIRDVFSIYTESWDWLIWHYPAALSSIAIHELGHALSCRHYRVRVTDFGIGVYILLATGWVRPEQREWSRLSPLKRAVTILMGPIASLYYTVLGVAIWSYAEVGSTLHSMGVVMIIVSSLSLVPTLLPIFNGDAYLALTEFFNQPRLRQRALRYCRQRLAGKPTNPDKDHRLYWLVTGLTVLGWLLAWYVIVMMIFRIFL